MTRGTTKKEKNRLILISLTMIALLIYLGFNVYSDFSKIKANKTTAEELKTQYESLLDEEKALTSEVTKMHDSAYVARYAKEKYMYSSENEIIIRID